MKMSTLCDAVFEALESQSDDFQDGILEVLKQVESKYSNCTLEKNHEKTEKLCRRVREILVLLRLFPLEWKLGFSKQSYGTIVSEFLVVYLNLKVALFGDEEKPKHVNETVREIFLILGEDDEPSIWNIIAKSCAVKSRSFFRPLVEVSLSKTDRMIYSFDQYICMVWVLYEYSRAYGSLKQTKVFSSIENFHPPNGIVKWLCHYFAGYGWKGLTDKEIHSKLINESQPKGFLSALRRKVTGFEGDDEYGSGDGNMVNGQVGFESPPESEVDNVHMTGSKDGGDAYESTKYEKSQNLENEKQLSENSNGKEKAAGSCREAAVKLNGEVASATNKDLEKVIEQDESSVRKRKRSDDEKYMKEYTQSFSNFFRGVTKKDPVIILRKISLQKKSNVDKTSGVAKNSSCHRTRSKNKF